MNIAEFLEITKDDCDDICLSTCAECLMDDGEFGEGVDCVKDAWTIAYPDRDHDPTCGIHDHQSWPEGPHCRDFFFVGGECARQVQSFHVDVDTDASDHQPLRICLERD